MTGVINTFREYSVGPRVSPPLAQRRFLAELITTECLYQSASGSYALVQVICAGTGRFYGHDNARQTGRNKNQFNRHCAQCRITPCLLPVDIRDAVRPLMMISHAPYLRRTGWSFPPGRDKWLHRPARSPESAPESAPQQARRMPQPDRHAAPPDAGNILPPD